MQPSLNPDSSTMNRDLVLLNKTLAWRAASGQDVWRSGDVVAIISPSDPKILLMKRLLGLPGAIVAIRPPHKKNTERFIRVPQGKCWVEGDEGFHSRDSTDFGPVPLGLMVGRVEYIIWPLSRMGRVPESRNGWEKRIVHPTGNLMNQ